MKKKIFAIAMLIAGGLFFTPQAEAQVQVKHQVCYKHQPVKRVKHRPMKPGRNYVWVDGHLKYHERRGVFTWVDGYWKPTKKKRVKVKRRHMKRCR